MFVKGVLEKQLCQVTTRNYVLAITVLVQTVMLSIDSMVLVIAKNQLKQNGIFFFCISEKYSFKGKRLTRLTMHLLVNGAKYFEREAKKPRAIQTLLRKHRKYHAR